MGRTPPRRGSKARWFSVPVTESMDIGAMPFSSDFLSICSLLGLTVKLPEGAFRYTSACITYKV